jgi:DNA-binding NtrC family response regulator
MTDRNILLLDANEQNQFAFNLFLENEGFRIIHARSEAETIKFVEDGHVMAVFIDSTRLDSDDEDCLISKLINIAPHMPIILLCSLPSPQLFALPEQYANIFILEKPLSIKAIREILNQHILL